MYQVIARKYRPQTFHDVVNQEHVKTTLENAIAQQRIAHGYIFSGQRGTGKTTIARILARCLNCIQGPTATPCGECASCREVTGGNAPDVIEIDAASNRGINEMRELRENVRYQPARDRYKIFIIDEAHQITNEAFNALLKTIEEPPPWAVFVLCTTEAHKIPATIASRCQHFSFRSVDFEDLTARMAWICEQEGIEADPEALAILAQAGEGSVRDSLSALDQAIACCGQKLNAPDVRALLGAFSLESLGSVSQALAESDSRRMLEVVDELERSGQNLQHFSRELSRYFRNLLVAKIAGAETRLIAASAAQRQKLVDIASGFSEEDLSRYLKLSLDIFSDLQESLQPRFHLEIGLVRLVHAGRLMPIEQALAGLSGGSSSAPSAGSGVATGAGTAPSRSRLGSDVSQASAPSATSTPPAASRPSPFEADRLKKSAPAPFSVPPRTGPSPFELDRAKKTMQPPAPPPTAAPAATPAAAPEPPPAEPAAAEPMADGDWRQRLHGALMELGMPFTADAVENSRVVEANGELQFTTSAAYKLALRADDLTKALQQLGSKPLRIKVSIGDAGPQAAPLSAAPAKASAPAGDEEATARALSNPEVQRFREVFGGEIRKVRNLKE